VICYRGGCDSTDLRLVPVTPSEVAMGVVMRKCAQCDMYQNHVGDPTNGEPGGDLRPRRAEEHIPARYRIDRLFKAEAEGAARDGESEVFLKEAT